MDKIDKTAKSEFRNPKPERNSNTEIRTALASRARVFGFRSSELGARIFILALSFLSLLSAHAASDSELRQQLVKTLLSEGQEQQTNLTQLAGTGSKIAHDVLIAWTR